MSQAKTQACCKSHSFYLLVREEELEVLELATGIGDLVSVTVESLAVLVLAAGLVVGQHAQTVLHGEDLVIDATIVPVLVAQVVEALAQLSDQLVLLGGSDFDTGLHRRGGKVNIS